MIKYILISIILLNVNLYSQNTRNNQLKMVKIVDSLKIKLALTELEKDKLETASDSAYMALYIFDIANKKNLILKNGVYSWRVMGPHFSNRLFIYYNNRVFIFKNKGKINSTGVLKEYIDSINYLNISELDRINYLNAIRIYLKEEFDNN